MGPCPPCSPPRSPSPAVGRALDSDLMSGGALRDQRHQAPAAPRERPVLLQHRRRRPPDPHAVGRDEQDGRLPGPALTLALPAVLQAPGLRFRQHRPPCYLPDRGGYHPAPGHFSFPGCAMSRARSPFTPSDGTRTPMGSRSTRTAGPPRSAKRKLPLKGHDPWRQARSHARSRLMAPTLHVRAGVGRGRWTGSRRRACRRRRRRRCGVRRRSSPAQQSAG